MSGRPAPVVKICGLTRPRDAELAVELGARLVGLNFWPGSPRCLEASAAREVASAVRGRALVVGVFVDQPRARIEELREGVGLDLVQLHGEEPAAEVAGFGDRAIKALRLDAGTPPDLGAYGDCWGFLCDAADRQRWGGTGEAWDWARATHLPTTRRILVAGGVAPGRVAAVLAACRPYGLDVCSGVESAPGIKDREKMQRLFAEIAAVAAGAGTEEHRDGEQTYPS